VNSRIKAQLIADAGSVVARHPSLAIEWKDGLPHKIAGKYIVMDSAGQPQGDYDIEVRIPSAYPNGFPVLKETSIKIPRDPDYHMSVGGTACVENPRGIMLLERQGIILVDYFNRFVHRYFCWQLVAEIDGIAELPGWAHGQTGIKQFYRECCGTDDENQVRQVLAIIAYRRGPQRNHPCFCGSGRKYKQCHLAMVQRLDKLDASVVASDLRLFSAE
jgi:hypothetical protein